MKDIMDPMTFCDSRDAVYSFKDPDWLKVSLELSFVLLRQTDPIIKTLGKVKRSGLNQFFFLFGLLHVGRCDKKIIL